MLYNHFNRIKNFILDLLSTNKRVGITGNLTTTIGMTPVPTPKIPNGNTTTNVENKALWQLIVQHRQNQTSQKRPLRKNQSKT